MCRLSDFGFLDLETERKLDLIKGALNSEEKAQPITYLVAGDEDLSIWEQYSIRESTSIGHRCNRGYRRRKRGTWAFESSYASPLTIWYPMYRLRASQTSSTFHTTSITIIQRRCLTSYKALTANKPDPIATTNNAHWPWGPLLA
jgi:hypothetical protein